MKLKEPKKYFTSKGVETYEYGYEFESNDFKVGDQVMVYGGKWAMSNDEYPNTRRFYLDTIVSINKEKGFITLSNGYNYRQERETTYLWKGCKEVECLARFKSTVDPEYISKTCYNFDYTTIETNNIRPRYVFLYTEQNKKEIADFIKKVEIANNERKQKEIEKKNKEDIYNKYKKQYDNIMNPLEEKLKKLEEKIYNERCKAFDNSFCANCKSNCINKKCAYEREWHSNDYIDKNHMYEYDNEKYRSRPINECKYFEEKENSNE